MHRAEQDDGRLATVDDPDRRLGDCGAGGQPGARGGDEKTRESLHRIVL
jgi:hypothetical protein